AESPLTNRPLGVNSREREVAETAPESAGKPDDRAAILPGRMVVWDIETTGYSPSLGHKIVAISAVELQDGIRTGAEFHQHVNPQFDPADPQYQRIKWQVDKSAKAHGLTEDTLK